jgi:MFS family permease
MADPSHDAITNEMQQEWEKGNRVGELRAGEVVIPPNGYIGAVVYAAVCFLLVFTSFNTAASTLTLIFPTFGSTNLMIIFYVFGVFSIVAPAIVARLDPKWCIVLSTLCFTFWIGTLMSGILGLVIFGSVMVGVASGVIWVATGPYLGRSRRGSLANNVFWLIFFTSWLFGGVIGGIVLNYLDKVVEIVTFLGFGEILNEHKTASLSSHYAFD